MADTIATNPPAQAPNGVAGFFSFLGGIVGTAASAVATDQLAIMDARNKAKVQQILNDGHAINGAIGANDPNAAQLAANKTFLERFLPDTMLYTTTTDPTGKVTSRTPTFVYYIVIGALLLGALLLARKFLKRA